VRTFALAFGKEVTQTLKMTPRTERKTRSLTDCTDIDKAAILLINIESKANIKAMSIPY